MMTHTTSLEPPLAATTNDNARRLGRRAGIAALALVSTLGAVLPEWENGSSAALVFLIVVFVSAALSFVPYRGPARGVLPKWLISMASLAAFAWAVFEIAERPTPTIIALGHFFTMILAIKLLDRDSAHDDSELLVTTLFLMVIGAIISGHVNYGFLLLCYLIIGVPALIALHMKHEHERIAKYQREGIDAPGDGSNTPTVCAAAAPADATSLHGVVYYTLGITITAGVLVFLLCPRFGTNLWARAGTPLSMALTGFTDSLELGDIGEVKKNRRPVMRVKLRLDGEPFGSPDLELYFRGMTLDSYRQGTFTSSARPLVDGEVRPGQSLVPGYEPDAADLVIEQEIKILSPASRYLFACPVPLQLTVHSKHRSVRRFSDGSFKIDDAKRGTPIEYTVKSLVRMTPRLADQMRRNARTSRARIARSAPLAWWTRTRAINPRFAVSDEFREYAAQLVRDLPPPTDSESIRMIARAIEDHLTSGEYKYSLSVPYRDGKTTLDEFVLREKVGFCEHFAAAMTVMCQTRGLRARVVNGYRGGEWNSTGGYYLVREQDAHSWVEVYTPDGDWATFDPTPGSVNVARSAHTLWSTVRGLAGHAQVLWADSVVSYTSTNRETLIANFGSWLTGLGQQGSLGQELLYAAKELLFGPAALAWGYRLVYWFWIGLVVFALVMAARLARRFTRRSWRWVGRMADARKRRPPSERFYSRALDLLAERGHLKRESDTPLEHLSALAGTEDRFTKLPLVAQAYYRVHFGHCRLTAEEHRQVEIILNDLSQTAQPQ